VNASTVHTTPGELMLTEIREQPDVLARQLDTELQGIRSIAARLREARPAAVLLAARGTSDHAALYARCLIETTLGLPCGVAPMPAFTAYRAEARYQDPLWIATSQSGGSPDLIQRRPVSMSVITGTRKRSGTSAASRSYSSGARMRALRGGTLGSSMLSHGLVTMTRSRTARLKTACSITWYLRTDVGDSPELTSVVTRSCIDAGRISAICRSPKCGRKCLAR
jgi:hypothetical protein